MKVSEADLIGKVIRCRDLESGKSFRAKSELFESPNLFFFIFLPNLSLYLFLSDTEFGLSSA